MKTIVLSILACSFFFLSGYSFGACGDYDSCGRSYCNPYETSCQCTDPVCNKPWDSNCVSRAYCCHAFGNIGGR